MCTIVPYTQLPFFTNSLFKHYEACYPEPLADKAVITLLRIAANAGHTVEPTAWHSDQCYGTDFDSVSYTCSKCKTSLTVQTTSDWEVGTSVVLKWDEWLRTPCEVAKPQIEHILNEAELAEYRRNEQWLDLEELTWCFVQEQRDAALHLYVQIDRTCTAACDGRNNLTVPDYLALKAWHGELKQFLSVIGVNDDQRRQAFHYVPQYEVIRRVPQYEVIRRGY